jgi:hypothetical protein
MTFAKENGRTTSSRGRRAKQKTGETATRSCRIQRSLPRNPFYSITSITPVEANYLFFNLHKEGFVLLRWQTYRCDNEI